MNEANTHSKVVSPQQARDESARLRRAGKVVVTVNGSFDVFHAGHVLQLEEARAQGDVLFVGLNSDVSVHAYKGAGRPIMSEQHRALVLSALSCVSYVVILDDVEAGAAIIELVRPRVHANGSEYGPPEAWTEYPAMAKYAVRGYVCQRRPGLSTSEIIDKIRVP